MQLCAFLAPDNIPLDVIRDGAAALPEPLEEAAARPVAFNTAVGTLLRYSLARRDGEVLSIHRLVQAITRDRLPVAEDARGAERAATLMSDALPDFPPGAFDARVAALYDRLLPHALAATMHAIKRGVALEAVARVQAALDALLERRQLEAAVTAAQRGEIALTRLRYRDAAEHFAAAARRVPPGHEQQSLAYRDREADALYQQGDEFLDNTALTEAIARYGALLDQRPRDRAPRDWAMTQNGLGRALWRLGERESGTERLEESVAAHRAALEEYTRERVPLQWAMTQNGLGRALWRLGERESGTERLEAAVQAFRGALEEVIRDRAPLGWALIQTNLGTALSTLGERESGTERLEAAVQAHKGALAVFEPAQASHYIELTRANLERAQTLLQERRGKEGASRVARDGAR